MFKKFTLVLMSCLLLFSGSANVVLALQPTHETEHVGNDFVDVQINKDNGRFSIKTKQGHPLRIDDKQSLLFADKYPDTSFTTFRIDGKDYIFGEKYGFMGLGSHFVIQPNTDGLTHQSEWNINGMVVTQTITMVDDVRNPNIGNVKIAYEVTNKTDQSATIGSRILLDTMLGAQDGSPIALSGGSQYIRTETDLQGSRVPAYWRAVDDPLTPLMMTYGMLRGWNNRQPDRMIIAHWDGISATTWDYQVQGIDFTTEHNRYGTRDSAVALYWSPRNVPAGESIQFETYYGLGSFFTAEQQAKYGVQFFAPRELQTNDAQDGYVQDTFDIHVEIDNTRPDARPLQHVTAEIGLPLELELAPGETRSRLIPSIEVGEVVTLTWRVKALPQQTYKAARYFVSIQASGEQQTTKADYIIMPALSGEPPELQLLEILPQKKYIDENDTGIRLKGSGFSALVNNWDATVQMTRESDGKRFFISEFTVLDDHLMQVDLGDMWQEGSPEAGVYTLRVDARPYGVIEQTIELTNDAKYRSRSYGLLAIVKEGLTYRIEPLDHEQSLSELDGEVLLNIRGDIREQRSGSTVVYEAEPGTTINSVIRFDDDATVRSRFGGEPLIRIEKTGDTIDISGTGVLSIPSFPFVAGPFSIQLTDDEDYDLEPDEDQSPIEIQWSLSDWLNQVATMAYFPVSIKNAVIGKNSVYFGGNLSLNFGSLKGDDPLKVGIDVDEVLFGLKDNNDFGFIGLRAEGEAGMPDNLLPGMEFGGEARVLIDTLEHIYEIEADINFIVIETGGLFTLRFINNSIPILDNFEFYVGGRPGIPIIPGYELAYITKGGGGFNNLYDTMTGNFNVLPPLTLVLMGGMSIGNIIFADDMRLEASLQGVSFESDLKIMEITIFDNAYGKFLLKDSLTSHGIEARIGADMSIFDIINGNIMATISFDSSNTYSLMGPVSMSGSGSVSLELPGSIPLFGSQTLADAYAYIGTDAVTASARFWKFPVSMRYVWGDRAPKLASLHGMPLDPSDSTGLAKQQFHEDGVTAGTMTYGSNIRQVSSFAEWIGQPRGSVTILSAEPGKSLEIPVGDQDYALFEFAYSGEMPELQITTPSEQQYELMEGENLLVQHISADESQSGLLEQYMFVLVENPENGIWKVTSDLPLTGGRLLDVAELPVVEQLTIESVGTHEVLVEWQSDHVEEGMEIALYLSEDGQSDSGRWLKDGLPATGSTTIQLPETLPSGDYYIRAALMEGGVLHHDLYSTTSVSIQNAYELPAPEKLTVKSIGSGIIQAEWDFADEADGFMLQVTDEHGDALPGIGVIQVDGDQTEAKIGGTYQDPGTGEELGLLPGETYRLNVTAFQEIDGVNVMGQPAVSDALYVPQPNPAAVELTVQVNGETARQTTGDHGDKIYIVNQPEVQLVLESDQPVQSDVHVNDTWIVERSGDHIQQTVTLVEGLNRIDVVSANAQGDRTISSVQVRLDTQAPDLKIQSPQTVILTSEPTVSVQGVAEMGSKVQVDGKSVETDPEGRFASDVSIEGYVSRDITVTAEDEAGNRSVYTVQALNESVESIERVEIRLSPEHDVAGLLDENEQDLDYEMLANASIQLELIGIDEHGDEYQLHPDRVEWSLLLGQQSVSLDGGVLQADDPGDIVVHASYRIAADYALQDAFTIRVHPDDEVKAPDYDDWYDENWKDPYPRNPSQPNINPNALAHHIDRMLQQALQSIIEAEQGTVFYDYIALIDGEDQVISVDHRAELKVFAQQWDEDELGVGIGTVTDADRFMSDDPRQLIGDIYELKTNKPVNFEQSPVLVIRFGLDEVSDPDKLAIYWYNEDKRRWEYIGGDVDVFNGTVTAELPHFSKYALLYDDELRRFSDLDGRWSADAIYRLRSIGVIDGWQQAGEWTFAPEQSITRQEFVKMLVASMDVPLSAAAHIPDTFSDRAKVSAWAVPYMNTAIEQKWIAGAAQGDALELNPLQHITRAEACAMLSRMHADLSQDDGNRPSFTDAGDVPEWASQAISRLESEQILSGYPDGTFRPMNTIKREEAAVMILRFLEWSYRK